jgi:hypothetical protein
MQSRKDFFSCTILCEESMNGFLRPIGGSLRAAIEHNLIAGFPQLGYTQDLLLSVSSGSSQGRLQGLNPRF